MFPSVFPFVAVFFGGGGPREVAGVVGSCNEDCKGMGCTERVPGVRRLCECTAACAAACGSTVQRRPTPLGVESTAFALQGPSLQTHELRSAR